ncbi:MAG: dihydrodipicolinate synthase family protein, partial [Sediminibacterium sp.]|nr:dihydrodipicolinate synthase family protein [Sediminibacterium sp.]
MVRACLNNDYTKARTLNNSLMTPYDLMFVENNPAGVKAFMAIQGLISNQLRMPNVPLSEGIFNQIKLWIDQQG